MNLKPVLGTSSWPQTARRRFLTLVKEKILIGKIIKFDAEENVAVMGLVDTTGIKDIHINDVLYNERLADLIAEVEGEHNPDEEHPYLLPLFDDLENGRGKSYADLEIIDRENLFEDFANKDKLISSAKESVHSGTSLHHANFSDAASQGSDDMCFSDRALSPILFPFVEKDDNPFQQPNISNVHSSTFIENDPYASSISYNHSFVTPVDRYPLQFNSFVPQQNIHHVPMMNMNPACRTMNPINPPMYIQNPQNLQYNNCYPSNICPDQIVYYPHSNGMPLNRNFQQMPLVYNHIPHCAPAISRPQQFQHNAMDTGNFNQENHRQLNNLIYPVIKNNDTYDRQLLKSNNSTLPSKIENNTCVAEKPQNNKNTYNYSSVFDMSDEDNYKNLHGNIAKTSDENVFDKYTNQKRDTSSENSMKSFLKAEDDLLIKHTEQINNSNCDLNPKASDYIPFSSDIMRSSSPDLELRVESAIERRNEDGQPGSMEKELCEDMDELVIAPKVEIESADMATLVKVETVLNRALEIWVWNSNEEPCVLLYQAAHQLLTPEGKSKFKSMTHDKTASPSLLMLASQSVTESIFSNLADDGLSGILIGESILADPRLRCNGQVLTFVPFKFFVATMRTYRPHLQVTIPELFMIAGSLTSSFKRL